MQSVHPEGPRGESEPENITVRRPSAEPAPEWETAKDIWGDFWPMHWIGFSLLFLLLALVAVIALVRILRVNNNFRPLRMLKFSATMLVILIILAMARCLNLFINPYESGQCISNDQQYCPVLLSRLLDSLVVPSISTAYILLYLALAKAVKLEGSQLRSLQKWKFLVPLVTVSYSVSVTSSILTTYLANAILYVSLCHGYFILLTFLLLGAGLQGGLQIIVKSKKSARKLNSFHSPTAHSSLTIRPRLRKILIFTVSTTILAVSWLLCQIYGLVSVNLESLNDKTHVHPWNWFIYQTLFRLTELLLGFLLYYFVSWGKYNARNQLKRGKQFSTLDWVTRATKTHRTVQVSGSRFTTDTQASAIEKT